MYRIRCSEFSTLLAGCGKANGKLEWKDLDKMNESHIRLAIEIYNKAEGLFTESEVCTLDMNAGKELEGESIKMYDKHFGTSYFAGYEENRAVLDGFEASNEWMTGTRDFGDDAETIDGKISTNKNVFNAKIFAPPEVDYIIQLNGYGWLYGTPKLKLYNSLMPATFGQVKKMVDSKAYIDMLDDDQRFEYEQKIEASYSYDFLETAKRINVKEIPNIVNFQDIVKKRVEVMNNWIETNKQYL